MIKKYNGLIIKLVKHHHVDDAECKEPYFDSEIVINDKRFIRLGAYDSDQDPCDYFDGFVDGVKYLDKISKKKLETLQIEYEHRADYDEV